MIMIPLYQCRSVTERGKAIVDVQFADRLGEFEWRVYDGYAYCTRDSIVHQMHNVVWEMAGRKIPEGKTLDHSNRNRIDNRLDNLRPATPQQQAWNHIPICCYGSKFHGLKKTRNGFIITVTHKGKYLPLGPFDTDVIAAQVYNATVSIQRRDFAILNDLPSGIAPLSLDTILLIHSLLSV